MTMKIGQYFLALLSEGISVSGFRCYAWVLMENHYHLLLRVNEHSLSVFMRQLNSKYARWFRKEVPTAEDTFFKTVSSRSLLKIKDILSRVGTIYSF